MIEDDAMRSNRALAGLIEESTQAGIENWIASVLAEVNENRRPGSPPITRHGLVSAMVFAFDLQRQLGFANRKAVWAGIMLATSIFAILTVNGAQDLIRAAKKVMGI